jgi:hypothetical protein
MSESQKSADTPADDAEASGRGQRADPLPDLDASLDAFYAKEGKSKPHRAVIVALFGWIYEKESQGHKLINLYRALQADKRVECSSHSFIRIYKDLKRQHEEEKRVQQAASQAHGQSAAATPRPSTGGATKAAPLRKADEL